MAGDFDNLFGDGPDIITRMGVLDVLPGGWGLLRRGGWDVYVPQSQIAGFALKTGDTIIGRVRAPKETEQSPVLVRLDSLNGVTIQH